MLHLNDLEGLTVTIISVLGSMILVKVCYVNYYRDLLEC